MAAMTDATVPAFRLEPSDSPNSVRAVPDSAHAFYFDHPLGHLPGLLLLDIAFAAVEHTVGTDVWFTHFEAVFRSMAALHVPVEARVTDDGPDGTHLCILSQQGKTCAEFACHVVGHEADGSAPGAPARPFTPVPLAAVRKLRPENVFLGEPQDGGLRPLAAARQVSSTLAAARGGFYRPVYLVECFLQLCRASRAEPGTTTGAIPASREILVQLGGHLPRPVPTADGLHIAFDDHGHTGYFPANPRALRRTASILLEDDPVCHFFCDAIPI